MNEIIDKKVQELVDALRNYSHKRDVSFNLFVNSQEHSVEFVKRAPTELKKDGISMRNLRGDFICD